MKWLLSRLVEKSTIITLITLGSGLFGYSIAPEHAGIIAGGVISVLSAVGILTKEG